MKKIVRSLVSIFVFVLVAELSRIFRGADVAIIQSGLKGVIFVIPTVIFITEYRNKMRKTISFYLLMIYTLIASLSIVYTISLNETIIGLISLYGTISLGFLILKYLNTEELVNACVVALDLVVILSLISAVFTPDSAYDLLQGKYRLSGITYGAHAVAVSAALNILLRIIRVVFFSHNRSGLRFKNLIIITACMVAIYLSDSRQTIAGLIVSLTVIFWVNLGFFQKFLSIVLCFGGILFLFLGDASLNILLQNFSRTNIAEIYTLTGRTAIWSEVIDLISKRPWLGYGFHAGQEVLASNYSTEHGWSTRSAHNSFLQSALDVGFIGATALVIWFMRLTYNAYKNKHMLTLGLFSFILIICLVERGIAGGVQIVSFFLIIFSLQDFTVISKNAMTKSDYQSTA